jgi:uncharacterized repeat protein (TIGR03803 family)
LYGTTANGGAYGYGIAYKVVPGAHGEWTETVLHSFCSVPYCPDGAFPWGPVVLDLAGNLYGTAGGGGAFSRGVVFEIVP